VFYEHESPFQMSITQGTTSTDLSTLLWVISGSSYAHLYVQGGFQHCVLVICHDFHILIDSIFDKLRVLKQNVCLVVTCLLSSSINNIHVYNPNLNQISSRNQYKNSAIQLSMCVECFKVFGMPELEIYVHI
jgi:hypothetical protein